MLAVFEDVCNFGIAVAVRAWFYKAYFHVEIAVPVLLRWRHAKRRFKFSRWSGF